MGKRLSETRRCFSVLAFILLLVTLFGSHLPWMAISEHDHKHTWQISETGGDSGSATFYMDMYFNLMSVEACQTYTDNSAFFYAGQIVCSVMSFSDSHKNTVDIHDWSMYSDSCASAGLTAFVLLIAAICIFALVILITTFKMIQKKCCKTLYRQQHGRAKCIIPSCAVFAPICGIVAILLYFVQCINNAAGTDVVTAEHMEDVQRSATGYEGFWLGMAGTLCLVFWWILFTIWFCGKKLEVTDFNGGVAGSELVTVKQDSDDEENSRRELVPRNT